MLTAMEILDALSRESFVELRNYGGKWGVIYRTAADGVCRELVSGDFYNLMSLWVDKCRKFPAIHPLGTDEGVYEQTAGIAPNDPNEVAMEGTHDTAQ